MRFIIKKPDGGQVVYFDRLNYCTIDLPIVGVIHTFAVPFIK